MTKEELAEAITCALDNRDHAEHEEDHSFIQMLKEREGRRIKRIEKFQQSFIGALAVAMVSGLAWIGSIVLHYLTHPK